jgi:Zn-dependent protease
MDGLQEGIQRLGYQFVPFLLAVVGHEFGHGLMAYFWGDHTAKENDRLTLNPIPHLDMIGTVLFPIINMLSGINLLIGWAKPVPIDPRRFRKYRSGLFWVSFAGPLANAVMAFMCALSLCLMVRFAPSDFVFYKEFSTMFGVGIQLNFGLGIFNLIPLPPLDGSKMIESFLNYNQTRQYEKLGQFSFFILLGLMFTGAISFLGPPIMYLTRATLDLAAALVGVS